MAGAALGEDHEVWDPRDHCQTVPASCIPAIMACRADLAGQGTVTSYAKALAAWGAPASSAVWGFLTVALPRS
jgi:hypothetical protein